MRAEDVHSPRDRIRDLQVIYTNRNEGWSIAEMEWRHEDSGEWRWRVGMRWDGEDDELGNPRSSGHPTWFLVPEGEIADMISAHAQHLARNDDHA